MLSDYGIPLWAERLIIAAVILIGTILASYIVRLTLEFIAVRLAAKTKSKLDDEIISAISKPVFLLTLTAGIDLEIQYLAKSYEFIGEGTYNLFHGLIIALAILLVSWLIIRLISTFAKWYVKNISVKTETRLDDEFIPIFERSLRTIVVVLALMAILSHFKVDIMGLVAVLGVGSLAIALAAQDTLANMIAGFILMIDRPFRIGDRIILPDGRRVDVYEIGLRSSKFMTFDKSLVIIPNSVLSKMTIDNISYPVPRIRIRVDVGVAYGSDIDKVKELLLEAAHSHPKVLKEPEPYVQFTNFGDSSLDFVLYAFVPEFKEQWRAGNEVRETVYKIFKRESIEIPFPQRVVYLNSTNKEAVDTAEDK